MNMTLPSWPVAVIAITGIPLFLALVIEYAGGLVPCPLCLMQRVWMMAAGGVVLIASIHGSSQRLYAGLTTLMGAIGGGFSIRHLYLQSLPEHEAPSCGPDIDYMFQNFPLLDVLETMTRGTGDCAKVTSVVDVLIPVGALLVFLLVITVGVARALGRFR